MAFLGITIDAVDELIGPLRRWRTQVDDIAALISQAETMSDISTNVLGMLDDVGSDGRRLANHIAHAAGELTAFRISEFMHPFGFEPAAIRALSPADRSSLVDNVQSIRAAHQAGRSASATEYAELSRMFSLAIEDEAAAQAAYALAVRGYPVFDALRLATTSAAAQVYDDMAQAMASGTAPAESGLPVEMFPLAYRRWHGLTAQLAVEQSELIERGITPAGLDELVATQQPRLAERNALNVVGADGMAFSIDDGEVSELAAISAAATWVGPTASSWMGASMAALFEPGSDTEITHIANVVRSDTSAALAFMNTLGSADVAQIPNALETRSGVLFDDVLGDYSVALANVSGRDGLVFSGADLVRAGSGGTSSAPTMSAPSELLLLAGGFSSGFLVSAAAASVQHDSRSRRGWHNTDRRSIAMQSIVTNGHAAELVAALAHDDELAALLEPDTGFGPGFTPATSSGATAPVTTLLTHAGTDPVASTAVVQYLHDRGAYDQVPLGTSLPDRARSALNDFRVLDNTEIVEGLSGLLAAAAIDYVDVEQGAVPITRYVELQLGAPFFSAYDTVLLSGSGDHLAQTTPVLLNAVMSHHLRSGDELGADAVSNFAGVVYAVRDASRVGNAELADRAAANFSRDLGLVGLVTGLVPGAHATTVSGVTGAASLMSGSDNSALGIAKTQLDEALGRSPAIRAAGVLAIFGTGLVRTSNGRSIGLQQAGTNTFQMVDEDGDRIPGDGGASFSVASGDYVSHPAFDELVVHNTPLAELLAELEAIDGDIDSAQLVARRQLSE